MLFPVFFVDVKYRILLLLSFKCLCSHSSGIVMLANADLMRMWPLALVLDKSKRRTRVDKIYPLGTINVFTKKLLTYFISLWAFPKTFTTFF